MVEPTGIPNFEGGEVLLSTGDVQVLKVSLSSTHIDVNVEDKAFIKRIIALRNQPKAQACDADSEATGNPPQIGGALSTARKVADALCSRGITITVSYQGSKIATIGADANPTLLQYITKTRGIAINSIISAAKMMI